MSVTGRFETMREDVPYWFASPTEQLRHDLGKSKLKNVRHYLMKGADINATDSTGRTALIVALHGENYPLAMQLIRQGVSLAPRRVGKKTHSVLYDALRPYDYQVPFYKKETLAQSEIALLLLQKNVLIIDEEKEDLLDRAVNLRNKEIIDMLLGRGITLNQSKKSSHLYNAGGCKPSPLSTAATIGANDLVMYFLQKGMDVNGVNDEKACSPLFSAILRQHPDTAVLLIANGADVHSQDTEGNTAWTKASRLQKPGQLLEVLEQYGAKPKPGKH